MEYTKDNLFPILYGDSEFISIIEITYSDSIFLEDFGIFKEGEVIPFLLANIEDGVLYQMDEDWEVIREQGFKCIAYN